MATPSRIRTKTLPPPSDLSFISPTLVTRRHTSPTDVLIFHRRGRSVITTTMSFALLLCFTHVLILEPGSPSATPSRPPHHAKYFVLSPLSTRLTGLTTTTPSSDASFFDGALGESFCKRKTLILMGLMGLGLATGLVGFMNLGLAPGNPITNLSFNQYLFIHPWKWAVCLNKITRSPPNTGSPSRPFPLRYPTPKVLFCGLLQQFTPSMSTSCFIVSISILEPEKIVGTYGSPYVLLNMLSDVYEIHIVFSEITYGDMAGCLLNYLVSSSCSLGFSALSQTHSLGCINVVYDYVKLVGAFVSGIQVKIIQGLLYNEQASPTNTPILCFIVLFVVHFSVEIPSSTAPVVTI